MPLPCPAFALAAMLPLAAPTPLLQAPEHPRDIVRHAVSAARGDSAPALRARWRARLARDSSDRAAVLGLATLARLTYDYPLAERLYRPLAAGADGYAVYARLGLAQGFDEYGRMLEVDGLLTGALAGARTLGDSAAQAEAMAWLAYVRARSHGLEAGAAWADSALGVVPERAPEVRALARCRRAQLLILLGRGERGAALAGAETFARQVGDPVSEAPCIRARAIALGHRGRADSAEALYRDFVARLRRLNERSAAARMQAWQALVLREDLANYGDALEILREAEAEARATRNEYGAAVARLFLGQLRLTLNDYPAAALHLDEAVAAAEAVADSEVLMVSRSWRGLVSLAARDLPRARRETLGTLEYFRRQGDLENQAEVMRTLANIAIREGDWSAAEAALDSAEALLRRLGAAPARVAQPFDRGRLALFRGDLDAAAGAFSRWLASLDSTAELQRYEARTYLADTHARRGELEAAERELRAAADHLERWRATLSARDLRVTAFQANATAQNDRNASVARALAALASGGRAEAAFELAERRRARELVDRLLQHAAVERGPAARGAGAAPHGTGRVSAAEVAARLPQGTALLEYVTGALGAPTTVFVLTRAADGAPHLRARVLPAADSLTGAIARFLALVSRGESVTGEARALGAALLDPAVEDLGPDVTRLVIVPDGALHRVPWDALRLRDGRWAVERWAIGTAPSAALLAERWRRAPEPSDQPPRLLAFGDPVFPPATLHQAFAAGGGLPRLRGSGREVRAAARHAPGAEVRLREEASESRLKRSSLRGYRILHLATHAVVNDRVAVRTALALAPGRGEDGFVTPGDLARLRLDADLVVLSACRTAGGVVVDGEGVQGLVAPLLEAGARSVVATTWRVGDETTADLVDAFYAALARGASVAEALRAAKLAAMRDGESAAVWAAFTVVGDPFVSVPLGRFARRHSAP